MRSGRIIASVVTLCLGASVCLAELSTPARKAERLIGKGNIDEAMALYKELTEKYAGKNPALVKEGTDGLAKCLVIKAKESMKKKDYADAKAKAEQAIASYGEAPSLKDAQAALVAAQVEISSPIAAAGRYAECVEQGKAAQAKAAADTEGIERLKTIIGTCLYAQAEIPLKDKKYADAAPILESIVKDYPQIEKIAEARTALAAALTANGTAAMNQNRADEAAASFLRVTKDFPENAEASAAAYNGLAALSLKAGKQQEALSNSREASKLEPDNTEYLFQYAGILYDSGETDTAKTTYTALLGLLQDELPKTYVNKEELQYKLGQTYLRLGKYTEAAVEFDKALTRNPLMIDARAGLAKAQFSDKNYAGATQSYNQLISQLSAEFEKTKAKLAGDRDSIEIAKRLEDIRRQIAVFHYQNGLTFEQTGDYAKAIDECRLGFEGVSTQEAALTLKRLQAAAQKKAPGKAPEEKKADEEAK